MSGRHKPNDGIFRLHPGIGKGSWQTLDHQLKEGGHKLFEGPEIRLLEELKRQREATQ